MKYALEPTIEQIELSRILRKSWIVNLKDEKEIKDESPHVRSPKTPKIARKTSSKIDIFTNEQMDFLERLRKRERRLRRVEKDSQ